MKDEDVNLHNQYEDMSVHELIRQIADWGRSASTREIAYSSRLVGLEAALRKAVVRELNAGKITFTVDEHGTPVAIGATEIKAGTFLLVPEEILARTRQDGKGDVR
jgi:hypothetical protein